jgi:hypothetical protein
MPPKKTAENQGCWTCKLRRKRCNEGHPKCHDCESLEIDCKYGAKPSWMDGADRQKQKATMLKEEIKRKAAQKREKAHVSNRATDQTAGRGFDIISDVTFAGDVLNVRSTASDLTGQQRDDLQRARTLVASLPWGHQHDDRSETLDQASASEMNFIMKYLDFFFPAIFPYYQPHVFDSGRTWLLTTLRKSKIAYHAVLGLACYYFTMTLTDVETGSEHMNCKLMRWEEVDEEVKKCFESLRSDIAALNLNSAELTTTTLEKAELLTGITQLIVLEMSMGRAGPWDTHLPAVVSLFEEVMASPEARTTYRDLPQSDFASVLLGIGEPLWTNPGVCNHIWSPGQGGFRFCAGLLILIDVVASTALQQPPRLVRYHDRVLARHDDGFPTAGDAEIRLSAMFGCRNWVTRSIAEISTLDSWKKDRLRSNNLSVAELDERAAKIDATLLKNIDDVILNDTSRTWDDRLGPQEQASLSDSRTSTLIWGYATKLYFLTVVDGWCHSALGDHLVSRVIGLLLKVSPEKIRTLAWPLCVAGCLALGAERMSFLGIIERLPKTQRAGALDDAQHIMQEVWRLSATFDPEEWSIAACFAVSGTPILIL